MPNWCECELKIAGNPAELKKFKIKAETKESVLDHDVFIPYPKKYKNLDKKLDDWYKKANEFAKKHKAKNWWSLSNELKEEFVNKEGKKPDDGFNSGGYEWCCNNWGTKWGICRTELVDEHYSDEWSELEYSFEAAWCPPLPVIKAMSKKFPKITLTIRYFECGVGYHGYATFEKGEVVEENESEYYGNRGG